MRLWLVGLVTLMWAGMAMADVTALPTSDNIISKNCRKVTLCSGHAATSVCTGAGADQIVFRAFGTKTVTFFSTQSTGTYVLDVVAGDLGHDAASANGYLIDDGTLDGAVEMLTLVNNFDYIWIDVDACTACSINVTALACK